MSVLLSGVQSHGQSALSLRVKWRRLLTRVPPSWSFVTSTVVWLWLAHSKNASRFPSAVKLIWLMQNPGQCVSRTGLSIGLPVLGSTCIVQKLQLSLPLVLSLTEEIILPSGSSAPSSTSFVPNRRTVWVPEISLPRWSPSQMRLIVTNVDSLWRIYLTLRPSGDHTKLSMPYSSPPSRILCACPPFESISQISRRPYLPLFALKETNEPSGE